MELAQDVNQDLALQVLIVVCEHQVAAQDQMESPSGKLLPEILPEELDPAPERVPPAGPSGGACSGCRSGSGAADPDRSR